MGNNALVMSTMDCLWVCVGGWVCYHDNSKLHASILTKMLFTWIIETYVAPLP